MSMNDNADDAWTHTPVEVVKQALKPVNFFERNPGIDALLST
jgi:Cu2+-containing amine oxidase